MANKEHISETPATLFLRKHQVAFSEHPYAYEEKGGTAVSARELGVTEHAIRVGRHGADIRALLVPIGVRRDSIVSTVIQRKRGSIVSICPYLAYVQQYAWGTQ